MLRRNEEHLGYTSLKLYCVWLLCVRGRRSGSLGDFYKDICSLTFDVWKKNTINPR